MAAVKPTAAQPASAPPVVNNGEAVALTPATVQAPPQLRQQEDTNVAVGTTSGISVAQLADKFEAASGAEPSSGGAIASSLRKPPPVPRAEYEAALARKDAGTSLPHDEVTLSHAAS